MGEAVTRKPGDLPASRPYSHLRVKGGTSEKQRCQTPAPAGVFLLACVERYEEGLLVRTKAFLMLMAFVLVIGAGCGYLISEADEDVPGDNGDNGEADEPSDSDMFPVTEMDQVGREITVEEMPERIISLAPSNTEILFALGLGERVVGVDTHSDYPEEAAALPRVGDAYGLNYEDILELSPDLIFMIGGSEEARQDLVDLGLVVAVIQPGSFEEILESFRLVGRLCGAVEEAEELVTSLEEETWSLMEAVGEIAGEDRPLVFLETWNDPLMTVGPGGFLHELVEMAGGNNLAHDAEMEWFIIEEEVVLERDPDVIITFFEESYKPLIEGRRSGWESVKAVVNERVHTVDSDLLVRPGPRVLQGLRELAEAIHPQLTAP